MRLPRGLRIAIVNFLQTTKLNRLAHKLYYKHIHGFDSASQSIEKALQIAFNKAIELGNGNRGDYLEFGVFKGYSLWKAQEIAEQKGGYFSNMRFFGFDSFQGLPEIKGVDETQKDVFYQGQYQCDKQSVVQNLDQKGIDWKKTFLIEGFFNKSLTKNTKSHYKIAEAAIALIDCDIYASTVDVLNFLSDILINNTILIFDDWDCFEKDDNRGQRRAFREFLDRNQGYRAEPLGSYGNYGKLFIIRICR